MAEEQVGDNDLRVADQVTTGDPSALVRWTEYFQFLDALRASGVTNMYGAGPYVQQEFGVGQAEARSILTAWMGTFADTTPNERARLHLGMLP